MKINFKERTINGVPYEVTEPRNDITLQECLSRIEELYHDYKYSTPTENDKRRSYFYALPPDKMTDEELIFGNDREQTKEVLELYVLEMIVCGVLVWDKNIMHGNWFYKGNDPDLVILREWID